MRVLAHGHSVVRSRALVSLEFVIDIGHSLFYVVHKRARAESSGNTRAERETKEQKNKFE